MNQPTPRSGEPQYSQDGQHWWTGTEWIDVRPSPAAKPTRPIWVVLGSLGTVAVVLGLLAFRWTVSADPREHTDPFTALTADCDDVAAIAMKLSAQSTDPGPMLLEMGAPRALVDNRDGFQKPGVVLACVGDGEWSSGPKGPVKVVWSVDAVGTHHITDAPVG